MKTKDTLVIMFVSLVSICGCTAEEPPAGAWQSGPPAWDATDGLSPGQDVTPGTGGSAGDGSAGDGSDSEVNPVVNAEAARQFAAAECALWKECYPTHIPLRFGDEATCVERLALLMEFQLSLPDTGRSAQSIVDCAQQLTPQNVSCDDLVIGNLPGPCRAQPGTRGEGQRCVVGSQCDTSACERAATAACGLCVKLGQPLDSCISSATCDYGLLCVGNRCEVPGGEGVACTDVYDCWPGLICQGAKCTRVPEGTPCENKGGIECGYYQYCSTTSMTCVPVQVAPPGGICGYVNQDYSVYYDCAYAPCPGDGWTGTCPMPAADGAACNNATDVCIWPATCDTGVCKLPDPTACN